MKILIGCSGFYYNHWKEKFYPSDLPKAKWLQFYSSNFNTVEINSSYYRMPNENMIMGWYDKTPKNFKITLKGYGFLTHKKRLNIDDEFINALKIFMQRATDLKEKLISVLWQLPRRYKVNLDKLETFCKLLNEKYSNFRHVIEFRDESWFNEESYDLLKEYNMSFCMISSPLELPEFALATNDLAYLRFHGKKRWYNSNYDLQELIEWKNKLSNLNVKTLLIYFNNDTNAFAIFNAKQLISLMEPNLKLKHNS